MSDLNPCTALKCFHQVAELRTLKVATDFMGKALYNQHGYMKDCQARYRRKIKWGYVKQRGMLQQQQFSYAGDSHRLSPAYFSQHPRIQEDMISDPIIQRQAYCDTFFETRPGPSAPLPSRRRLQPRGPSPAAPSPSDQDVSVPLSPRISSPSLPQSLSLPSPPPPSPPSPSSPPLSPPPPSPPFVAATLSVCPHRHRCPRRRRD
jgi:hypothetical protein